MIRQIRKAIMNFIFAVCRTILKFIWPGYSRIIYMDSKIHELNVLTRNFIRQQSPIDFREINDPDNLEIIEDDHLRRYEFACTRIKDGAEVLDIACGIGYGSYMMSKNPKTSVTGVDVSAQTVEYAKNRFKRKNLQFVCSDANGYRPPKGKKFDVIVSFETIEHLELDKQFVEKIVKFLKPGGIIIVSTPNFLIKPRPLDYHYRHYTPIRMSYILKKYGGLEILEIYGQPKHKNYDVCKGLLYSYLGDNTLHIARKPSS